VYGGQGSMTNGKVVLMNGVDEFLQQVSKSCKLIAKILYSKKRPNQKGINRV